MHIEAPLTLHKETVRPEWIDYNGHMNLAYYVLVFDHATDEFLDFIGMDSNYRARTQCSMFTLEMHVNYEREVEESDAIRVRTQLLDYDPKRLHYFHSMYHADEEYLAATTELIVMHIDMAQRRSSSMPDEMLGRVAMVMNSHRDLPLPSQVGRVIGIRRKSPG